MAPSSVPFEATCPYPLCRFATSSLPLLAFGHFPLTGGIGPLTRGVTPQWEGLRAAKGRPYGVGEPPRRTGEDTRPYANTGTAPFPS